MAYCNIKNNKCHSPPIINLRKYLKTKTLVLDLFSLIFLLLSLIVKAHLNNGVWLVVSSVSIDTLFDYTSNVLSLDNSQNAFNNTKKGLKYR